MRCFVGFGVCWGFHWQCIHPTGTRSRAPFGQAAGSVHAGHAGPRATPAPPAVRLLLPAAPKQKGSARVLQLNGVPRSNTRTLSCRWQTPPAVSTALGTALLPASVQESQFSHFICSILQVTESHCHPRRAVATSVILMHPIKALSAVRGSSASFRC